VVEIITVMLIGFTYAIWQFVCILWMSL